jgi:hypothetical protein
VSDSLNQRCQCLTLDEPALHARFDAQLLSEGGASAALIGRDHLFSPYPVFVSPAQRKQMLAVIAALQEVFAAPSFQHDALAGSEWPDQRTHGVMSSFDFHPQPGGGVRLIEINTNAGGAYLSALLAQSQYHCCGEPGGAWADAVQASELPQRWLEDFRTEWQLARGQQALRRVLIVDDAPESQFLYPEFLLFRELFRRHDIACEIADPGELTFDGEHLIHRQQTIDLVYNRLTDFELSDPRHRSLRDAYAADAVVLTPSPRHHALLADKRHLVRLADTDYLAHSGISAASRAVLAASVPPAVIVSAERADELWRQRKRYFFKPFAGYGSRGAYRGEGLTRRVWAGILAAGNYIAQEYTPAPTRRGASAEPAGELKFDLRCVAYAGEFRLLSARLYQGQTTNLRTPTGGLGSVIVPAIHPQVAAVAAQRCRSARPHQA